MRLTLSLAIMSSLIAPVWTKSYKKADPIYWVTAEEDDEDRYLAAQQKSQFDESDPYSNLIEWDKLFCQRILEYNDTDEEKRKFCKDAQRLRRHNIIKKTTYRSSHMMPFAKDLLLGFLIPWIAIYVLFPFSRAATKKYLEWVLEKPNQCPLVYKGTLD